MSNRSEVPSPGVLHPLSGGQMSERLAANIAALTERRARERAEAPWSARLAAAITRFTGSMTFVVVHLVIYAFWIVANLGWIPGVPPWDETFVVLAMEASVEAIFLSTFVLINQNRQGAEADRRAELDLHVGLLAEDELTKLARLIEAMARKLDVPLADATLEEVKKNVDPNRVLDALDAAGGQDDDPGAPAMKSSTAS